MLISCRFSIIGLHLLLLTHIAHSFVLLTANVEDVKKIARKFVSDSLAEKIADFIARATETMAQNKKVSEENVNNADAQDSSQVSAENRMYNIERHGGDSQATEGKSREEIVLGKVTVKTPKKTSVEKKSHTFEEPGTTRKPRKEPKPLHGKSRYIVQSEKKASLNTEKVLSKISKEEKYSKMQESIQLLEDKLLSTSNGNAKNKKQKRNMKGRPYKFLSGLESVENNAAKGGIPNDKGMKDDKTPYVRANDEKMLSLLTEEAATGFEEHDIEVEKQNEKGATDDAQHEIKGDKNTEMVGNSEPLQFTEKDEFENNENKIIQKTDKVMTSGSRSLAETDDIENWWEKEIPANNQEVNSKGKSWF